MEATATGTEARLLGGLSRVCAALPKGLGLVDAMATLRRGGVLPHEQKVVIVLDQFEQWLFAHRSEEDTELVAALRHCDGERLQAIVLVRDDFWLAASRFMRELEIRLIEGENSALVDLFDFRHARKVLVAIGRAYGALPAAPEPPSRDQEQFLDRALLDLPHGAARSISVQLAFFAEMVKSKPWTPATLSQMGGTEGVGVTFLEETFSAATSPPEHRMHQEAARGVLRALLPASGSDNKGQMRSETDIATASGYAAIRPSRL